MNPGDIYVATVPYKNRDGGKDRPVIVVKELANGRVFVVESRGDEHTNLELLGIIDLDAFGYRNPFFKGKSYFYACNVQILSKTAFKNYLRSLNVADYKTIVEKVRFQYQKLLS